MGSERVCVIGAGSSGIAACQVLAARGIPFDCFEKGSGVGGNWRYENDNGMSAAYRSLHINTSKGLMAYRSFPMPSDYPDYPSHFQIAAYFESYVDHFGFAERIYFQTEVTHVKPTDGQWEVTVSKTGGAAETNRYSAVLISSGHHWNPRWPEPAVPGSGDFAGEQMHAHDYRHPDALSGKRVLVLGIGNSAADIAVESSRVADKTFLAMRRGAHVMPKYLNGKPIDKFNSRLWTRLPIPVQRLLASVVLRLSIGDMTAYGLPKPDHGLLQAHPTVSAELLNRLGHGDIEVKTNLAAFEGPDVVRFADGSEEKVDLVVYCTGYKISFPFLDPSVASAEENRLPLYRRVASPDQPGLFFIGFIQPLGATMPIAEAQAEWVADLLQERGFLPSPGAMHSEIAKRDRKTRKRYVTSKRHTIQVDFHPYIRELRRERRLAALRSRTLRPSLRFPGASSSGVAASPVRASPSRSTPR